MDSRKNRAFQPSTSSPFSPTLLPPLPLPPLVRSPDERYWLIIAASRSLRLLIELRSGRVTERVGSIPAPSISLNSRPVSFHIDAARRAAVSTPRPSLGRGVGRHQLRVSRIPMMDRPQLLASSIADCNKLNLTKHGDHRDRICSRLESCLSVCVT